MAQQSTEPKEVYCEHYGCRCLRSTELSIQGRDLEAIAVHNQKVKCRQVEGAHFFNSIMELEPRKENK